MHPDFRPLMQRVARVQLPTVDFNCRVEIQRGSIPEIPNLFECLSCSVPMGRLHFNRLVNPKKKPPSELRHGSLASPGPFL